jgi:catechol 2,3-dioxygenase-like lactoylglutathione lyase family enzyme
MKIKDIIMDCQDPEVLAAFWSEVLDRPVAARIGPFIWLVRGDGPGLGFQRVDAPKAGKNRVHFDVGAADPAAERERLEALGARYLPEYAGGGFLVMADPEGNEFCVIPEGPFEVDDEGRADYLPRAL